MKLTLAEALRLGPGYGDEDIVRALSKLDTPESRTQAAQTLAPGQWDALDYFAARMASMAVRLQRIDLVKAGLVALDVALLNEDGMAHSGEYRAGALLYRACELIDPNPREKLRELAQNVHGPFKEDILLHLGKHPISIEDAGFMEVEEEDGFRFQPAGSQP